MAWRPTAPQERIMARKLDGETCEFKDLKPGDVFQAIAPDGTPIHPCTEEPDDEIVALVVDFPVQNINNRNGNLLGEIGYGVPIEVYASASEIKGRLS